MCLIIFKVNNTLLYTIRFFPVSNFTELDLTLHYLTRWRMESIQIISSTSVCISLFIHTVQLCMHCIYHNAHFLATHVTVCIFHLFPPQLLYILVTTTIDISGVKSGGLSMILGQFFKKYCVVLYSLYTVIL